MSTIREDLEEDLVNHGLWPKEATEVLDQIVDEKNHKALAQVLNRSMEGYPPQVKAVAMLTTRGEAKKWLKEHHPQHFALAMLEGT